MKPAYWIFLEFLTCLALLGPETSDPNLPLNIPIKLEQNIILIEATVNGEHGHYILDTGTPFIYLNDEYFTGKSFDEQEFSGVLGKEGTADLIQAKINIRGFKGKSRAYVRSIQEFDHFSTSVLGCIGYHIFRKHRVTFDLDNSCIELQPSSRTKKNDYYDFEAGLISPTYVLPYTLKKNFPLFKAEIKGQKVLLGFDSGAAVNVLSTDFNPKQICKKSFSSITIRTMSGSKKVNGCVVDGWIIQDLLVPEMSTVFQSLEELNLVFMHKPLDGLLGVEFLKQFKMTFDFRNKELNIW